MASLNPQTLINENLSYFSLNGGGTSGQLANPSFMSSVSALETIGVDAGFTMKFENGFGENTIIQNEGGIILDNGPIKLSVQNDVAVRGVLRVENTAGTQGLTISSGTVNTVIAAKDGLPTITLQNVDNSIVISNDLRVGGSISLGNTTDSTTLTADYLSFGGSAGQIGGILQNGTNIYVGSGTNLVGTGMKFDAQGNATLPGDITSSRSSTNHGGNLIATADNITASLTAKGSTIAPTGNGFLLSSINNVDPNVETLNAVQLSAINGTATSEITSLNGRLDVQATNKSVQVQATNGNVNLKTTTAGDINIQSADEFFLQTVNTANITSGSSFTVTTTTGNIVLDAANQFLADSTVLTNVTSSDTVQVNAPHVNILSGDLNLSSVGSIDLSGTTNITGATTVTGNINLNAGSGTLQLTAPTTNVNGNLAVTGSITGTIVPNNPINLANSPNRLVVYCDSGNASLIRVTDAPGTSGTPAKRLLLWTGANAYVHSDGDTGRILILNGADQVNFQTPLLTQNGNALIGAVVNTAIYSGTALLSNNSQWYFNCRNPAASYNLSPAPVGNTPLPGGLYSVQSTAFSYQNETRSIGGTLSYTGGANGNAAGFFLTPSTRSYTDDYQWLEGTADGLFRFNFKTGGGFVGFSVVIVRLC